MTSVAGFSLDKDLGHQMANYEKVLYKGLSGIKQEVEMYSPSLNNAKFNRYILIKGVI